jgi:hypothetical protein
VFVEIVKPLQRRRLDEKRPIENMQFFDNFSNKFVTMCVSVSSFCRKDCDDKDLDGKALGYGEKKVTYSKERRGYLSEGQELQLTIIVAKRRTCWISCGAESVLKSAGS